MIPEPTPLVTVTQADREAAAKALCAVHGLAMDIGPIGYAGIVRALVRHAANARLAALEEAAKVAEEEPLTGTECLRPFRHEVGKSIATAILALSTKEPSRG